MRCPILWYGGNLGRVCFAIYVNDALIYARLVSGWCRAVILYTPINCVLIARGVGLNDCFIRTKWGGRRRTFSLDIRCLTGVFWKRIAACASHRISCWIAKPREGARLPIYALSVEVVWHITVLKCNELSGRGWCFRIGKAVIAVRRIRSTIRIFAG